MGNIHDTMKQVHEIYARFVGAADRAEAEAAQMRLMREGDRLRQREFRPRAGERPRRLRGVGQGHQERDAAPLGVADLARPLRNGQLGGDSVDAGAVSFRDVSMRRWIRRLFGSIQSFDRDAAPEQEETARREAARKGSVKRAATLARKRAIAEKARAEARAAFGGGIYLARCVYTYGWQEYGVYAKDAEHAQFLMEQWLRSDDGKSEITTLHEDAVSNYQSAMEDYSDVIKDYRAEKKAGVSDEELDLSRPKTKLRKTEFKLSVKTITKSNLDTKDFEIEEVQFHDASDGWNHDINPLTEAQPEGGP